MDAKLKKKILFGAGGFLIAVLVIVLALMLKAANTATLDILVAPSSAKIVIDGKEYKNGKYEMGVGEIVATISEDGFETKEIKINMRAGQTEKLYVYLLPGDGSYSWYLEHPDDMMILNTIGDAAAAEASSKYTKENPIVEILPIIYANYDAEWNYTEYRVDGGRFEECKSEFCLKITDTTGGNYEKALEYIREKGFEPEKYEIIYAYRPIEPLE